MPQPLIQTVDAQTGETITREMNAEEYASWQAQIVTPEPIPTKEQLQAELQALLEKINSLP